MTRDPLETLGVGPDAPPAMSAEPVAELEPEAELEPAALLEPVADVGIESEPVAEAGIEPEPEPQPGPEAELEPVAGIEPERNPESEPVADAGIEPVPEPAAELEPEAELEPVAGIEPDPDPDPVADPYTEPVTVTQPEPYEQLRFVDVVMVLPSTNAIVILEEVSYPCRLLRIPIGTPEGVAIGYAARGIATPKPLTHDLFTSVLEAFNLTLDYVRITGVRLNAFSAELVVSGAKGSRTLPCRPSDGIALALRQRLGAPIVVAPEVLDQVGVKPEPPG